jgi:hypothetical protein
MAVLTVPKPSTGLSAISVETGAEPKSTTRHRGSELEVSIDGRVGIVSMTSLEMLRQLIDAVIVPALVERFLREHAIVAAPAPPGRGA